MAINVTPSVRILMYVLTGKAKRSSAGQLVENCSFDPGECGVVSLKRSVDVFVFGSDQEPEACRKIASSRRRKLRIADVVSYLTGAYRTLCYLALEYCHLID